ncbi:MAG: SxtJ family membrane protein [Proteobacteria bacterium]|nr:SxtJ family membrane protein [Pseudomonadota bacterium]
MSAFESLVREESIEGSSDRSFGLVFSAFFSIIGCWPLTSGGALRLWALLLGGLFLLIAVLWPSFLAPLNRLWMRLGILLGKIVSPVALAIVFVVAIVPIGWLMRRLGKDPLRLTWDPAAKTYWILRQPPGPPPSTMNRQF